MTEISETNRTTPRKRNWDPRLIWRIIREHATETPMTSKWGRQKIQQVLGDALFEDEEDREWKRKRRKKLQKLERKIVKAKRKRRRLARTLD